MIIFESVYFTVTAHHKPHIDRSEGGHIKIAPKERVRDRQSLAPEQAIELMRLTIVTGEAMTRVLRRNGIDIGRINYQDNGNWSVFAPEGPYLHIHLYGRAKDARKQPYGQACFFPHMDERPEFYEDLEPLSEEDCSGIRAEIERLLAEEVYSDARWGLELRYDEPR